MASFTLSQASRGGCLRLGLQTYFRRYCTEASFFLVSPMTVSPTAIRFYSQAKNPSTHYQVMCYSTTTLQKSTIPKHHTVRKRNLNERHHDRSGQFRIKDFLERPKWEEKFDQKAATRSFYEDSDRYLTAHNFLQSHRCKGSENDVDIESVLAAISDSKGDVSPAVLADSLSALARQPQKRISQFLLSDHYDPCLTMVSNYCKMFTDKDFVTVLVSLHNLGIPVWHRIYRKFISECERRVYNWDIDTMLLVSDTWRAIGRVVVDYNGRMLKRVEPQYLELTHHQLVQLLYVIGENRTAPLTLMKKLEDMVLSYVNDLNGKEIAAICLGYFKSQTIISSAALLQILGDKACEHFDQLDFFSAVSVFKAFRHATTVHLPLFKKAAATFSSVIQDLPLVSVMQLVFTYGALHIIDKDLLEAVSEKAVKDARLCRIKDIAKFLWTFAQLNFRPANVDLFLDTMVKELYARSSEFQTFPEHLVYSVVALAYMERFPYDLINTVFNPDTLQQIQKYCPWETMRDLYVIDGTVGVECEDYTGHRLSQEFIKQLPEGAGGSVKHELTYRENLAEVVRVLEQMMGRKQLKVHHILPHFKSTDIEIHVDQTNQAMMMTGSVSTPPGKNKQANIRLDDNLIDVLTGTKSESSLEEEEEVEPENQDTENITRLAVQVTSMKHHLYNSHSLLGVHQMKRRQLRKLGYQVVEIPYYEWLELPRHPNNERKEYLRKKIFGHNK
ncbi:FAST kinase domain-containing protein 5, mitochondrial-like [Branchiostoma lanceolatum]|uniref:FAST kinase domain-containing protein 5, mitochondrial-like n=1 Tax=Branchiostoma lanceolatum TaxID=7740 RepID=UPI003452F2F8